LPIGASPAGECETSGLTDAVAREKSGNEVGLEVVQTDPKRVEGIVRTGILFDDEPLAAGALGLGDDAGKGKRALADFREEWLPIQSHPVVLEMEKRQAAPHFAAPLNAIASAGLHPVGVQFGDHVLRCRVGEDILQNRRSLESDEFDVVVVISERDAGCAEPGARRVEFPHQGVDAAGVAEIDAFRPSIGREPAAEPLQGFRWLFQARRESRARVRAWRR